MNSSPILIVAAMALMALASSVVMNETASPTSTTNQELTGLKQKLFGGNWPQNGKPKNSHQLQAGTVSAIGDASKGPKPNKNVVPQTMQPYLAEAIAELSAEQILNFATIYSKPRDQLTPEDQAMVPNVPESFSYAIWILSSGDSDLRQQLTTVIGLEIEDQKEFLDKFDQLTSKTFSKPIQNIENLKESDVSSPSSIPQNGNPSSGPKPNQNVVPQTMQPYVSEAIVELLAEQILNVATIYSKSRDQLAPEDKAMLPFISEGLFQAYMILISGNSDLRQDLTTAIGLEKIEDQKEFLDKFDQLTSKTFSKPIQNIENLKKSDVSSSSPIPHNGNPSSEESNGNEPHSQP